MVHTTCAVDGCLSSSRLSKELRFHQFPHSEERYKLWIEACGRTDLVGKTFDNLKNMYVCSLHFQKNMYAKKSLKKIAAPTLLIPSRKLVQTKSKRTQTDPEAKETADLCSPKKHNVFKPTQDQESSEKVVPSSLLEIDIDSDTEDPSQNEAEVEHRQTRKRKNGNQLMQNEKVMKFLADNRKVESITEKQFLKACDMYLTPHMSSLVKADLHLKAERKDLSIDIVDEANGMLSEAWTLNVHSTYTVQSKMWVSVQLYLDGKKNGDASPKELHHNIILILINMIFIM